MRLYTNEVVFRGHPDKVCDQISAAILAECMKQDENTRAGIEVAGGKSIVFVTGELTTNASITVSDIVRRVLKDVGYNSGVYVIDNIGRQSSDIALGTNDAIGGAGDQGMMFGYACNDNDLLLPTAMLILQNFAKEYDELRKHVDDLLPDGKAQITGVYDNNFKLKYIDTFLVSYQNKEIRRDYTDSLIRYLVKRVCGGVEVRNILINPTGRFLIGGFEGDAGLTGRKIVVDAYHSFANVGGGCMNGKDPTKVDFSAAHKARQLACRVLKKENLKWAQVQLSYAIGKPTPLSIYIDSDKGALPVSTLGDASEVYNECAVKRIIDDLDLKHIDFERLAAFGHFTGEEINRYQV